MKLPFSGRLRRTSPDDLSDAERNQRTLVRIGVQLIIMFMIGIAVIYTAISALLGGSLFIPTSATGVLSAAQTSPSYAWTSEAVRHVKLGGVEQTQDSYRTVAIDEPLDRWEAALEGVYDSTTLLVSDKKLTAELSDANSQDGWVLATDYCSGKPPVPVSDVQAPTAQQLESMDPKILNTQGTVFDQQAWVLSFKPTARMLGQLFLLKGLEATNVANPSENRWILSSEEARALETGNFRVKYAYAWVTYNQPRELRQIELNIRFLNKGGSTWRFLVKYFQYPGNPLSDLTNAAPNCSNNTIGAPTGALTPSTPGGSTTTPQTAVTTTPPKQTHSALPSNQGAVIGAKKTKSK